MLQRAERHDRGAAGEQGAGFTLYRFEDGWAFVRGPSGSSKAAHGITQPGEDGLAYNVRTGELHIVDNKAFGRRGNVRSATAIEPRRNLGQNLQDMIRHVEAQGTDQLPYRQEVLKLLRKTRSAVLGSRGLPARVSLIVSNAGGYSTGVGERLARQGITFRDASSPLVVRPGAAVPKLPGAGGTSAPPAPPVPATPVPAAPAAPAAPASGGPATEASTLAIAQKRGGKSAQRDIGEGRSVPFDPKNPPKYTKKSGPTGIGPRPMRASGVLFSTATNWVDDAVLNHAIAGKVLGLWEEIEGWRETHPDDYILLELWLSESNVVVEGLTQRQVLEVNAYHGATREDVEARLAAASRLRGVPPGMHAVGPFLAWIEPLQPLDEIKETMENRRFGDCFVATACYGSPLAAEVIVLRAFRDAALLPHPLGARFVHAYYRHSPHPAAVIARRPRLRAAVRSALVRPAVALARHHRSSSRHAAR
jgi:hypothetical protein